MSDIILFRFHKDVDICENRINNLNIKNPDIDIYGIGEYVENYERLYKSGMEHIHTIEDKSSRWKWLNGDLVIKRWFNDYGHTINFDRLYLVEWDMLLTDKINNIYPELSDDTVGLTGYDKNLNNQWFNGRYDEINYIRQYFKSNNNFNINNRINSIILPGLTVPKSFIELYNSFNIPKVGNDEIRISSVAEYSDYKIKPTELYNNKYFNCSNSEISNKDIKKDNNIKAYHSTTNILR